MTQHTSSQSDQHHQARYLLDEPGTPLDEDARPDRSGWWFGLLALLPIACCGLPLLVAAGLTAGGGVALGGITGAALVLIGAVALGIWAKRRRRAHLNGDPPERDRHC